MALSVKMELNGHLSHPEILSFEVESNLKMVFNFDLLRSFALSA